MGPASATDVLRKGLAMGADSAVHVLDGSLAGSDLGWTAAALAAAVGADWDLVITGNESTDGRGGVIAAMLAERLGVPHLTSLDTVTVGADRVSGERATEYGTVDAHAALPCRHLGDGAISRAALPRFQGDHVGEEEAAHPSSMSQRSASPCPSLARWCSPPPNDRPGPPVASSPTTAPPRPSSSSSSPPSD
jgi:electron transfer flavoprotein beta subunit